MWSRRQATPRSWQFRKSKRPCANRAFAAPKRCAPTAPRRVSQGTSAAGHRGHDRGREGCGAGDRLHLGHGNFGNRSDHARIAHSPHQNGVHLLHHAGFLKALPQPAIEGMIEVVKDVEPETGYTSVMAISEIEATMRESRIRRTKTVCTYCGVGCSFDIWTKDRQILKVEPAEGAANGVSTCVKGKFVWGFANSEDRLTSPLIRENGKFRKASWDEALSLVARRFSEIKAASGPDSLAFISSSKCT